LLAVERPLTIAALIAAVTVAFLLCGAIVTGCGMPSRARTPPAERFGAFSGSWVRHGMVVGVDAAGNVAATWRTYRWCAEAPSPCDVNRGTRIVPGGHGRARLHSRKAQLAEGSVTATNDPRVWPWGRFAMRLERGGVATLQIHDSSLTVCGPGFNPRRAGTLDPCGA
jgi:hypothetical protein